MSQLVSRLFGRRRSQQGGHPQHAEPVEPGESVRVAAAPTSGRLPVNHYGLTRFSLFSPSSPSWRLTRQTDENEVERYAERLFSAERMEPRCAIFCDLAAPLYQQMAAGHRFRHIVAYSPRMPQRWLERLQEAAERYPVLWLLESETDRVNFPGLVRDDLAASATEEDTMVYAFRIDDDDLLAADFLDQVEPYVVPGHLGYAVSFADGYAALWEDGRYTSVRTFTEPLSSMGLGAIGRWHAGEGTLDLTEIRNHPRTAHRRPVLLDAQRPTFVQTRHIGQDTALRGERPDAKVAQDHVMAKIGKLKPVDDLGAVYERFPTLQGRVTS